MQIGGVFVGSAALGFLAVKLKRRKKLPIPQINAIMRISSAGTVYRAHFIGAKPEGWAFTPPIQRDNYVAIKVGEPITMETVMDKGVAVFRTTLRERSMHPPMLLVDKPVFWHIEDRRDSIRIGEVGHIEAKLDGSRVGLLDMSACGARVRSQARQEPGQRVKLDVAGFAESIYGWVLDADRKGDRYIVRLRFEEETDMSPMVGA